MLCINLHSIDLNNLSINIKPFYFFLHIKYNVIEKILSAYIFIIFFIVNN
jgi:hypothetical protein